MAALEVGHGLGLSHPDHAVEGGQLLGPGGARWAAGLVAVDGLGGQVEVLAVEAGRHGFAERGALHGPVVVASTRSVPDGQTGGVT